MRRPPREARLPADAAALVLEGVRSITNGPSCDAPPGDPKRDRPEKDAGSASTPSLTESKRRDRGMRARAPTIEAFPNSPPPNLVRPPSRHCHDDVRPRIIDPAESLPEPTHDMQRDLELPG
jgi:hypothetical protein